MRIIITHWGLDSYVDYLHSGLFSVDLYYERLRPDILRLRHWPDDPLFSNPRRWGPAQGAGNGGWKMKWHNFGNGNVQFRLCVALVEGNAHLCHAYIKTSRTQDRLQAASLKDKIELIRSGDFDPMGEL